MSVHDEILAALGSGPMTTVELADRLERPRNTIASSVARLHSEGRVIAAGSVMAGNHKPVLRYGLPGPSACPLAGWISGRTFRGDA